MLNRVAIAAVIVLAVVAAVVLLRTPNGGSPTTSQVTTVSVNPSVVSFNVAVPATTPQMEPIVLHYGLQELLLNKTGPYSYSGTMNVSGMPAGTDVAYGYSRGGIIAFGECGFMGLGSDQMPRNFTVGSTVSINDTVTCWKWLPSSPSNETMIPTLAGAGNFTNRSEFWRGVYLPDFWSPGQDINYNQTIAKLKSEGFDWVALKPPVSQSSSDPIQYAPGERINCPSFPNDTLKDEIHAFKQAGMHVLLEVQLCTSGSTYQNRSDSWWLQWFSQVKKVVQYHAEMAKEEKVDAFVLQFDGALPLASGSPNFSSQEWSQIIDIAKTSGAKVSFSSGAWGADNTDPSALPYPLASVDFINKLDFLEVSVQNTLFLDNSHPTQAQADNAMGIVMSKIDYLHNVTGKPVLISPVDYASTDGSGLPKGPEVLYAYMDPSTVYSKYNVTYNDTQQAIIYEALMRQIAKRPYIIGIFSWGYGYVDSPLTPDGTIRGKMAERLLSEWFGNITAR